MELKDKKVLIVGFERTGEALCSFLTSRGVQVTVTEKKPAAEFSSKINLWQKKGVSFEAGGHSQSLFMNTDLIVPSPGVPPLPEIIEAKKRGIPVISEIELAWKFLRGKVIAITGSNGKSTTATLAFRILKEAGRRAFLAGNIGTPLISFVDRSRPDDIYVTEVSSFQLEYVDEFKPSVAVFLNISPNHIDWHGSFENYFQAKKNLFKYLGPSEQIILNRDDLQVWGLSQKTPAQVFGFSRKFKPRPGAWVEAGWIKTCLEKEEKIIKAGSVPLPGPHNLENVMAAAVIGRLSDVPPKSILKSIMKFPGLEHRLEKVMKLKGVLFVNDSKATTVDATVKALQSFSQPIVLILGGRDKGSDFSVLRKYLKKKVKSTILIGEAAAKIEKAIRGSTPFCHVSDYRQATITAFNQAKKGDVVLLAPACTSWDMFRNFEERGQTFKREIKRLARIVAGKTGARR